MKKVLYAVKFMILAGIIMFFATRNVEAFLFLPPMPPEPVIDAPTNITKILSNVQAAARKIQSVKSELNSISLNAVKGKLGVDRFTTPKSNGQAVAGKTVQTSSKLNLTDLTEEIQYVNAFKKLFLRYPDKDDSEYSNAIQVKDKHMKVNKQEIINSAYDRKKVEYQQDRIIETYVSSRVTEDYLKLVEKTLNRAEACLHNPGADNCVFFGHKFQDVKSLESAPSSEEEAGEGDLGQTMNIYIVTMLYDRLVRIVEDLTAQEAIYRAAEQLEVTEPYLLQESNAEDYINHKYHFAYTEEYTHVTAAQNCFTSSSGCQRGLKAEEKEENENLKVLKDFDAIEAKLDEALAVHNLKVSLPEYKTEYRQYLQAVNIHNKAVQVLKDSDTCIQDFLKLYGNDGKIDWTASWIGSAKKANDYEKRGSLSKELIKEYQKTINETIIGTSDVCEGYYETCADGYTLNTAQSCEKDENKHPCVLETIEGEGVDSTEGNDLGSIGENISNNSNDEEDNNNDVNDMVSKNPLLKNISFDTSSYLKDATQEEKMDNDLRIQSETAWQIGAAKMIKLTKEGSLKFLPWNDQQSLQELYLYNKYNNIKMIIESMDMGVNSYKVARQMIEGKTYDDSVSDKINKVLNAWANCPINANVQTQAKNKAKNDCNSTTASTRKPGTSCTFKSISVSNSIIYVELGYEKKNGTKYESKTYSTSYSQQAVDGACTFPTEKTWSNYSDNWNITIDGLVKSYFKDTLGGENDDIEKAAQYLYGNTNKLGRVVAQNKLLDVVVVRQETEKDMRAFIEEYNEDIKELKNRLTSLENQLSNYNEKINTYTKYKNNVLDEKKKTDLRIKNIGENDNPEANTELYALNQRIETASGDVPYICALSIKKMELAYERDLLKGKSASWSLPNECDDLSKEQKENIGFSPVAPDQDKYIMDIGTFKKHNYAKQEDDNLRLITTEAAAEITRLETRINNYKASRDVTQESIANVNEKLQKRGEQFTEDYINLAEKHQEMIEDKNTTFEDFLNQKNQRMTHKTATKCTKRVLGICTKRGPKTYDTDNLYKTISVFEHNRDNGDEKDVEGLIKEELEKNHILAAVSKINSYASLLGSDIYIGDSSILSVLGKTPGTYTVSGIIKDLVEKIEDEAVKEILNYIKESDAYIENEKNDATKEVEDIMKKFGVCEDCTVKDIIFEHDEYKSGGYVNTQHLNLIKKLRTPSDSTYITDLSEIFGIPSSEELGTDEEYFASMPARGNNYLGKSDDENAGRDYKAPKEPLLNLPPLREVFYYSTADYENTPKSKDAPAIDYLLNNKYPNDAEHPWEFLPETWRYLLAKPNLRNDGKYQQTFVERTLTNTMLGKLIDNKSIPGANVNYYRTIIGRSGSYPCKLTNGSTINIVDVYGSNDSPSNLKFVVRSLPDNYTMENLPVCKEIEFNSKYNTVCYKYNKGKKGICHVLADHGKKNKKGKLSPIDIQEKLSSKTNEMFEKYSELGQFLRGDGLKYRPMQKNIHEYLRNEKNTKNNIERQHVELAAFKRNLFGSFLEAVRAENEARKSKEEMEEKVKERMKEICTMYHDTLGQYVTGNAAEKDKEKTDEATKICAEYIMANSGLASDTTDNAYGVDGEYNDNQFGGIDCKKSTTNRYSSLYCELMNKRNELIKLAEDGFTYELNEKDETAKGFNSYRKDYKNKNKDEKGTDNVMERFNKLDNYISLLTQDKNGVVYITTEMNKSDMSEKIKNAKVDRTATRITDEEGIISMENQNQFAPYCPVYAYKKSGEK